MWCWGGGKSVGIQPVPLTLPHPLSPPPPETIPYLCSKAQTQEEEPNGQTRRARARARGAGGGAHKVEGVGFCPEEDYITSLLLPTLHIPLLSSAYNTGESRFSPSCHRHLCSGSCRSAGDSGCSQSRQRLNSMKCLKRRLQVTEDFKGDRSCKTHFVDVLVHL